MFPDSPINGQTHTESGIDYVYNGIFPNGAWELVPAVLDQLGYFNFNTIQTFANEAAATVGGLATNTPYKTATGELRIKL